MGIPRWLMVCYGLVLLWHEAIPCFNNYQFTESNSRMVTISVTSVPCRRPVALDKIAQDCASPIRFKEHGPGIYSYRAPYTAHSVAVMKTGLHVIYLNVTPTINSYSTDMPCSFYHCDSRRVDVNLRLPSSCNNFPFQNIVSLDVRDNLQAGGRNMLFSCKDPPFPISISYKDKVSNTSIKSLDQTIDMKCTGEVCPDILVSVRSACDKSPVSDVTVSPNVAWSVVANGTYVLSSCDLPVTLTLSTSGLGNKSVTINTTDAVTVEMGCPCATITVNSACGRPVIGTQFSSWHSSWASSEGEVPGTYVLRKCQIPTSVDVSLPQHQSASIPANLFVDGYILNMTCTESLVIIAHPQSKYRQTGQSVKLCCAAKSFPGHQPITYTWDKIGSNPAINVSTNKDLIITNLSTQHDGTGYRCTAKIESQGLQMSANEAFLLLDVDPTVPTANSLDFCPGSAKKGVKQCHLAPCISNALDIECIDSGSVQPNTSIAYEQCDTSFLPLTVVTGCQCRASSGFELNVTVHDADNNNPIPKIKVSFDGIEQTTNVYGNAVITIPFSNPNPVITLIDPLAVYLPSSKPLTITSLFGSEKMYMLKKGAPINIDPTKQNTLPMIPSSPNVKLEIPPNAFRTPDGKLPNGTVKLSISVFPPSLDIGEKAPGVFSARTSDGMLEELETQGVFTLTATDSANTPLNSGPIRVQAGNNFRLFELGGDGNWVLLTPMAVNKRRAADLTTFVGTISINTQMVRWYNIDKFSENSKCWVKLHVFDPITNELFQQASDTSYRVSIVETFVEGDTTSVLPMRYYLSTQHQCLEVRCNNPRTGYVPTGYFVMEVSIAFQNSLITIPSFPWPKENYAMPVQTILTALNYSTNNESPGRIKINMNASSDGVFFDNVTKCEMKTLNAGGNSLVFSAARPTSADPYNGTSQRCVARVRVNLDNFSSVEVSSPLNFTSTSIWGNSFFRAYGQTSDFNSTSGKIVFCMEYRCSTAGEQTSSSVTLNDGVFAQVRFYCNSSFIAPVRSTTGLGFFLNNQSNVTAAINECNGNTSDFALDKNCTGIAVEPESVLP